jgi:hypothetical protein
MDIGFLFDINVYPILGFPEYKHRFEEYDIIRHANMI